jgi:AcrR family transcriptional regulator
MTTTSAPRTARARVRAELTREIKALARRQLAESGAAALSLRAIAREMNMASSALYRYFASRDELLTALIVDAYDAVGLAAADAEAKVRRGDFSGRWMATARAVRSWAIAYPQEYALIFGSPVPGYQAPAATIDPATRIPLLLIAIVLDASHAGFTLGRKAAEQPLPRSVRADLEALGRQLVAAKQTAEGTAAPQQSPTLTTHQLGRAVMAWSQLIGLISFELFGHLNNVIHDYEAHFDYQLRGVARELGISKR